MNSLATMLKTPGALVECDDDPEAVFEYLCAKGWSDGLPVIPPTPERVERMLAYCDRDFDKPVVKIPPRTLNFAVNLRYRGRVAAARSSRMRFETASWYAPWSRYDQT